jgi:hypothetical protein
VKLLAAETQPTPVTLLFARGGHSRQKGSAHLLAKQRPRRRDYRGGADQGSRGYEPLHLLQPQLPGRRGHLPRDRRPGVLLQRSPEARHPQDSGRSWAPTRSPAGSHSTQERRRRLAPGPSVPPGGLLSRPGHLRPHSDLHHRGKDSRAMTDPVVELAGEAKVPRADLLTNPA